MVVEIPPATNITLSQIKEYFAEVSAPHRPEPQQGYEIHDRGVFIRRLLGPLGYGDANILQDVSQSVDGASRTPDIRLYGNDEVRSRQAHSQLVIETKNFDLYRKRIEALDLLQLKRYVLYNRSRIRVIVATDFVSMFAFNATKIRSDPRLRTTDYETLTEAERKLFRESVLFTLRLDSATDADLQKLAWLSHAMVFEKHQFRDPQESAFTCDIADGDIRSSFLVQLFHKTRSAEDRLRAFFLPLADATAADLEAADSSIVLRVLHQRFATTDGFVIRSYLLWLEEMGYLTPFLTNPGVTPRWKDVCALLRDSERRSAFVVASVYSLINKTFFLRTLEDSQTENTRFFRGEEKGRYISNGILQKKYEEGVASFVGYIRDLFQFNRDDLRGYHFLLHHDIFSWVLEKVDTGVLIDLVRLFNDLNFRKLNQDILGDIYEHYLERDRTRGEKSYRQLLGQYYTPKPIVRLMWLLVRNQLQRSAGRDIYETNKPILNVLDPCYGSGTFLTEGILQCNASALRKSVRSDGRVLGFLRDRGQGRRIEDSLTGFELNPLSKAIADVNLYFALIQAYGAEVLGSDPIERLRLFRTDSFGIGASGLNEAGVSVGDNLFLFADDIQRTMLDSDAVRAAKSGRYDIVIANPPYGDAVVTREMRSGLIPFAYAANHHDQSGKLIEFDWSRTNESGRIPDAEKNRGKLNDMYAFFFGVADRALKDGGVLAFITANTWLTIPTYKYFRRYFLSNYTIDTVINFNNISDRISMFAPDAGIATAIVVMRKCRPEAGHKVRMLDLSDVPTTREKYEAFCSVKWRGDGRDRRDILAFEIKSMDEMGFVEEEQEQFLLNPDYMIRISRAPKLVAKLERDTARLSEMLPSCQGVDVGDLEHLVGADPAALRSNIEGLVYQGNLEGFGKTSKDYIAQGLETGRIDRVWDPEKLLAFVFQKDMQRWVTPKCHWVYMDSAILWRSRIRQRDRMSSEIFERQKLFVLERRESSHLVSLVTDEPCAPQHGGRFFYFVPRNGTSVEDLHTVCAMVNSRPLNYYYRVKSQGNKDVRVRRLQDIPLAIRKALATHSTAMHALHRDRARLQRGETTKFETQFFRSNVAPWVRRSSLLEESPGWQVELDGTLADCWVEKATIDPNHPWVVILNEHSRLRCQDSETATALLAGPLSGFRGDLFQDEVAVELSELTSSDRGPVVEALVAGEVARVATAIDELVCQLYDLDESERQTVLADP